MNMDELREIPNFPDYKINREGQVWSKYYGGMYLKQNHHKSGYVFVFLKDKGGKKRIVYIHRAVAITFIPNPNDLEQVHHLNAIRDDNHVLNLAWISPYENLKERHARRRRMRLKNV